MKKLLNLIAVLLIAGISLQAQEKEMKERHEKEYSKMRGEKSHHKMMMKKQLNLTDAQAEKMKSINETYKKQMMELKKNEDITIREMKARASALQKSHKEQIESVFTKDQKSQIEKMKADHRAMKEIDAKAKQEKMKIALGLSNEQVAKLDKMRTANAAKIKALKENDKLSSEQKKEQFKELMKKQKEEMQSVLTKEQWEKASHMRKGKMKKGKKGDHHKHSDHDKHEG